MSFSDELKRISYSNNYFIDKLRAILRSAAMDGKCVTIIKRAEVSEDNVKIFLSYLESQGFSVEYTGSTQEYRVSW